MYIEDVYRGVYGPQGVWSTSASLYPFAGKPAKGMDELDGDGAGSDNRRWNAEQSQVSTSRDAVLDAEALARWEDEGGHPGAEGERRVW